MQLSLPIPICTKPDVSHAGIGNAHSSIDPKSKDANGAHCDSFESLLHKDKPADDSKDEDDNTDTAKAAEMAAALLWMPMVHPNLNVAAPALPSTDVDISTDPALVGETDAADGSICFGTHSSRAFAPALTSMDLKGGQILTGQSSEDTTSLTGPMSHEEKDGLMKQINAPALAEAGLSSSDLAAEDVVSVAPATHGHRADVSLTVGNKMEVGERPGDLPLAASLTHAPGISDTSDKLIAGLTPDSAHGATGVLVSPHQKRVPVAARVPETADGKSLTENSVSSATANEAPLGTILSGDGLGNSPDNESGSDKSTAQEKNAALQQMEDHDPKNSISSEVKHFLEFGRKAVTSVGTRVGTSVAKLGAIMSAASTPSKTISISDPAVPFVFSGDTASTGTLTAEAPTPVSTVRETMAAILSAVDALERRADVQQKSVDLNLSVGHEKLGLRVELRDGSIHTTFRTESAEMNTVLAHEWRSMVQPTGERAPRFADPVFSSAVTASGESAFGSLGQGTPQNREQQRAQPTFVSALKREFYDSGTTESPAKDSPALSTSQLLNALA